MREVCNSRIAPSFKTILDQSLKVWLYPARFLLYFKGDPFKLAVYSFNMVSKLDPYVGDK